MSWRALRLGVEAGKRGTLTLSKMENWLEREKSQPSQFMLEEDCVNDIGSTRMDDMPIRCALFIGWEEFTIMAKGDARSL